MTYEEYRDQVVTEVYCANERHGWSVEDASACVADVRREYDKGCSVQFTAFKVMADAASSE